MVHFIWFSLQYFVTKVRIIIFVLLKSKLRFKQKKTKPPNNTLDFRAKRYLTKLYP